MHFPQRNLKKVEILLRGTFKLEEGCEASGVGVWCVSIIIEFLKPIFHLANLFARTEIKAT